MKKCNKKNVLSKVFFLMVALIVSVSVFPTDPLTSFKHFVIYGQSLSTGQQSWPSLSTENVVGNYMLGDQIWIGDNNVRSNQFTPLVANTWGPERNVANTKNRTSRTASECPLIGTVNHIQLKANIGNTISSSCGLGSASVETLSNVYAWSTYTTSFLAALKEASRLGSLHNVSISCPAIFWLQGEANYGGWGGCSKDPVAYKTALMKLKNDMQDDVVKQYAQPDRPVFFTYQTGAQYVQDTVAISMAQLEAANENSDIIMCGPVYQMTDRGGHLDPNGYRWYGEVMGKVYYKTQILGEVFSPLQPKKIIRDDNSKIIRIQYHVPKLPLAFDELTIPKQTNYGFEIFNNNVKQTITKITIENDNVVIECADNLTGTVHVVYAGTATRGNGNLRDSDDYPSFYKYIDLDAKNGDGTYVYERDVTETTLRPSYEPKDQNGNVIYNQNYPLQNWSIAFYYRLPAETDTFKIDIIGIPDLGTRNLEKRDLQGYKVFTTNSELVVKGNLSSDTSLSISDLTGKVLFFKIFKSNSPAESIVFPINQLNMPKGIYIAKIDGSKNSSSVKFFR